MTSVVFFLAVLAAGLAGFAVLVRLGLDVRAAWALGRTAGLVFVALPAWWAGVLGSGGWRWLGAALLGAGAAWGAVTVWRRRAAWREIAGAEAVFLIGFFAVLFLRLDHPQIRGTEKPMDLGILGSLLRTRSFPPPDMWLAGLGLPYYYWGALLWTVPLTVSHVPLEIGYNLIVALIGGLTAASVWSLAVDLGARRRGALLAAFFAVLAGTPDGLRQLLAGRSLLGLDYWASSRQVADTITEFPLFTFWLGDLHPHLLSLPMMLLAVGLALSAGIRGARPAILTATAAALGVTWAANPWAMPPALAAVAIVLIAGDGTWRWPFGSGWRRWAAVAAVAVGGWVLTAPFHLSFHPPFQGIGLVHAWTTVPEAILYAGPLLLAAWLCALAVAASWGGDNLERRQALAAGALVLALAVGLASGRPVLALAVAAMGILTVESVRRGGGEDRPVLLLGALGLFLLAVPEVIFVRDPYGSQLHRMNTVFKSYFAAWTLLAVALPGLLQRVRLRGWRMAAAVAVIVVPSLPHLVGMAAAPLSGRRLGLDGLRWLNDGDRAAVEFLRQQPPGTVMIEAVGHAYSDFARLSAASGVPTVLGWANHESVWRGGQIGPELERRRQLVRQVYTCGDPATVGRIVRATGARLVALGAMERGEYSAAGFPAVIQAGRTVLDSNGMRIVEIEGAGREEAAP